MCWKWHIPLTKCGYSSEPKNGQRRKKRKKRSQLARRDRATRPHGQTEADRKRRRWGMGGGTPGWGRSTIFLFCVVKLGWIPPARPPFTEPLEEILLLLPAVIWARSDPLWQLYRTGELHLRKWIHKYTLTFREYTPMDPWGIEHWASSTFLVKKRSLPSS